MGEEIGWAIGRLVAVNCRPEGIRSGEFIRTKVRVNVLKPLRCFSTYCYLYGLLDHYGADYDCFKGGRIHEFNSPRMKCGFRRRNLSLELVIGQYHSL